MTAGHGVLWQEGSQTPEVQRGFFVGREKCANQTAPIRGKQQCVEFILKVNALNLLARGNLPNTNLVANGGDANGSPNSDVRESIAPCCKELAIPRECKAVKPLQLLTLNPE